MVYHILRIIDSGVEDCRVEGLVLYWERAHKRECTIIGINKNVPIWHKVMCHNWYKQNNWHDGNVPLMVDKICALRCLYSDHSTFGTVCTLASSAPCAIFGTECTVVSV